MARIKFLATLGMIVVCGAERRAAAQLTIQQPVVDVSSVATTVSVPDRGRAFLGGVSSAGDSRQSFGPLRNGSSVGMFRSASGMSVSAYIHDFEEMDRALLSQASGSSSATAASPALDAYRDLLARNQKRGRSLATPPAEFAGMRSTVISGGRTQPGLAGRDPGAAAAGIAPVFLGPGSIANDDRPAAPSMPADQAARSFEMGRQAEQRGALGVARLHFQMAARRGHPEAESRLARLDSPVRSEAAVSSAPVPAGAPTVQRAATSVR